MLLFKIFKGLTFFFLFYLFSHSLLSEEEGYQAKYNPLICKGVLFLNKETYLANWTFRPTGGSGSEIDIRYNGTKRLGKIRTTVYNNKDLYGRGKWVGRTTSKTYNTLLTIKYNYKIKKFILLSQFNPDNFRLEGICK